MPLTSDCPALRRVLLLCLTLGTALPAQGVTCTPIVEARPDDGWMRVRPHEDAFSDCTLARPELARLLKGFLTLPEYAGMTFESLFLGRLVDHPWLSQALAGQALLDPAWDSTAGRPRAGDLNVFVNQVLSAPVVLADLQRLLEGTGYRVTGVTVEKVLVAPADTQPLPALRGRGLVPYDALAHLNLRKDTAP